MDITTISAIVSLLAAFSVAAERLVAIIKGLIPALNKEQTDEQREIWRQTALKFLAVIAGIITAILSQPVIQQALPQLETNIFVLAAFGLLISGGSGFWHSIQEYLNAIKDIRVLAATELRSQHQQHIQRNLP